MSAPKSEDKASQEQVTRGITSRCSNYWRGSSGGADFRGECTSRRVWNSETIASLTKDSDIEELLSMRDLTGVTIGVGHCTAIGFRDERNDV